MSERIEQDATGRAEIVDGNGVHFQPRYSVYFDAADDGDAMIVLCNDCSNQSNLFVVENMTEHDAWHEENNA